MATQIIEHTPRSITVRMSTGRCKCQPMGVATYRATADMPERLRKALPDENELKKY